MFVNEELSPIGKPVLMVDDSEWDTEIRLSPEEAAALWPQLKAFAEKHTPLSGICGPDYTSVELPLVNRKPRRDNPFPPGVIGLAAVDLEDPEALDPAIAQTLEAKRQELGCPSHSLGEAKPIPLEERELLPDPFERNPEPEV